MYFLIVLLASFWVVASRLISTENELSDRVEKLNTQVTSEFLSVSELLAEVLASTELKDYIASSTADTRKNLTSEFLIQAKKHPNIDQIRFIDQYGVEKVKVENPGITAEPISVDTKENIQSHYYFRDTMKLNPGEFFVSPLDLNIVDGKIEEPMNPTIRLASKVTRANDQTAGIVVINYKAKRLLDFFCVQEITQCTVSKMYFTNSEGYFFKAPDPSIEWGFMYPSRTNSTFQHYFPRAWQRIIDHNQGKFINSEGVFIFNKIFPVAEIQEHQSKASQNFTYFSRYLSVKDFHMVVILHAMVSTVLYQLLKTHIPHILILYCMPILLFCIVGLRELFKSYRR